MNSVKLVGNLVLKNANFYATIIKRATTNYSTLMLVNQRLLFLPQQQALLDVPKCNYSKKAKKDDKSKKPKVQLNHDELNAIISFDEFLASMKKVVHDLKEEYAKNLSLRFNSSSIEEIPVKTPEGSFKVSEIGQVTAKSPSLFVIDMINSPQYIAKVVDAINKSGLSLNPQIDKTSIFLNIPKVTREHRENLVKSARKMYDNSNGKLKDIHKKYARKVSDSKTASKDLIFQTNETIKYQFDLHVKEAEGVRDAKQAELLAS